MTFSVAGFSITVHYVPEFGGVLDIFVMAPVKYQGRTIGLLGVMNQNRSDDLTRPDGQILLVTSTDKDIYNHFGQKCRLIL